MTKTIKPTQPLIFRKRIKDIIDEKSKNLPFKLREYRPFYLTYKGIKEEYLNSIFNGENKTLEQICNEIK